jgi:hypothetical protein
MPALTSIAAGVGIAATATTTGMSFAQSAKQKRLQREAEAEAAKSMQEARKKLDVNFYKGLGIQKEPYELEREALLMAGAQSIQAGVESERGAGAVAGRVQMAQNIGQRNIAGAMGAELAGLDKLVATEESRLRDAKAQLDLGTVEGAQLAARNSENLANQSFMQGMQGVTSLAGQVSNLAPLYSTTPATRNLNQLEKDYNTMAQSNKLPERFMSNGQPVPFYQALRLQTGKKDLSDPQLYDFLQSQGQDFYGGLNQSLFTTPSLMTQ